MLEALFSDAYERERFIRFRNSSMLRRVFAMKLRLAVVPTNLLFWPQAEFRFLNISKQITN